MDWNRKYTTIAVYACLVILFAVLLVTLIFNSGVVRGFLSRVFAATTPVIVGFCLAYVLNRIMRVFEKHLFGWVEKKKKRPRLRRVLALLLTYLLVLAFLTLFLLLLVPQIIASCLDLQSMAQQYLVKIPAWVTDAVNNSDLINGEVGSLLNIDVNHLKNNLTSILTDSFNLFSKVVTYMLNCGSAIVGAVSNLFFGFVISIYVLYDKERLGAGSKKIAATLFPPRVYHAGGRLLRVMDENFGGYIVGHLFDALIVGLVTFVVLGILDMPYYPMVSLVVGVTNIVPYFGPFFGGLIGALLIAISNPVKALWFVLFVVILQAVDGNIIGPMLIHGSTGVSALAIIVSVTVMGGWFGVPGMLLAVPAYAVIAYIVQILLEKKKAANEKAGWPPQKNSAGSTGLQGVSDPQNTKDKSE